MTAPNRAKDKQILIRVYQSQYDYLTDMTELEDRSMTAIIMRALKAQYPLLEEIEQTEILALKGAKK